MLTQTVHFDAENHDDIVYPSAIPFLLVHFATLGILWSGVTWTAAAMCVGLYVLRMFAVTAGFHRYFSHRSYDTSRVFQFVLGFLAQTSLQKGVLWWAAKHRHHHKYSDTVEDVHSPGLHGFLFSHVGWIFARRRGEANYDLVRDLSEYPELRWLEKNKHLPGIVLAVACFLIAGWPGLFVGFFLSTAILYHGTFAINSLAHCFGRQRYLTGDDSRNNWWLALITLGEGWHNNHHYYQISTRQGFKWYEIDITYYGIKALSWLKIVRNLHSPPEEVLLGERRLSRRAVDKVAQRLAGTFHVDTLVEQAQAAWSNKPHFDLPEIHLPHMPSLDELKRRASEMALRTPSLDDVAQRAREILAEAVAMRLSEAGAPA